MAQGWTPGPWTACDHVVVVTPQTHGYATWLADCAVGGSARDEQLANARLIASAPAMADALAEVIAVAEGTHPAPAMAIQNARAALSAARGDA